VNLLSWLLDSFDTERSDTLLKVVIAVLSIPVVMMLLAIASVLAGG